MAEKDRSDEPQLPPQRRLTSEALEAYLLEVRNGAHMAIGELVTQHVLGDEPPAPEAHQELLAVEHAAEVALGILRNDYMVKREAMFDVWALIDRYPLTREELIEEDNMRQARAEEWIVPEEPEDDG